jgi:hypothetical protein
MFACKYSISTFIEFVGNFEFRSILWLFHRLEQLRLITALLILHGQLALLLHSQFKTSTRYFDYLLLKINQEECVTFISSSNIVSFVFCSTAYATKLFCHCCGYEMLPLRRLRQQ